MAIFTGSKKLNIALGLGFIVVLLITISGLGYAYIGTLMPYHKAYIGMAEDSIRSFNPELMYLISVLIRLYGFANIGLGLSLLFILFTGFRSKQKWAWYIFLFVGTICYLPLFIVTKPIIGSLIIYKIFIVMAILTFIQLAITFKEFFK